jgi:hypothetical protein
VSRNISGSTSLIETTYWSPAGPKEDFTVRYSIFTDHHVLIFFISLPSAMLQSRPPIPASPYIFGGTPFPIMLHIQERLKKLVRKTVLPLS